MKSGLDDVVGGHTIVSGKQDNFGDQHRHQAQLSMPVRANIAKPKNSEGQIRWIF
jgi:hypothetical protein